MESGSCVKDSLSFYDAINDRALLSPTERHLGTSLHGFPDQPSVIAALTSEMSGKSGADVCDSESRERRVGLVSELQKKQFERSGAAAVREAEKVALLSAAKLVGEEAVRIGLKRAAGKGAVKVAGKGVAVATVKGASKFVPVFGPPAVGSIFAVYRLVNGEYAKAGAELMSGVVGSVPGVGTAASWALDAGIAGWDVYDAYSEGATGLFDANSHVKLAELLVEIESLVGDGVFSLDDFVDRVFEAIDPKMKASTDPEYVAYYVYGIFKDFFSGGSLTVDASRILSVIKQRNYTGEQLTSITTLLKSRGS